MDIFIINAKRTPICSFLGNFKTKSAVELSTQLINEMNTYDSEEVIMGCVLTAGLGQSPTRQIIINSKLSDSVSSLTINKVCGSGMKSIIMLYDHISLGYIKCGLAGGMESMSNAPYLMKQIRSGYKFGNKQLYDHMNLDGLEDPYTKKSMGILADDVAKLRKISREDQDKYTYISTTRTIQSINNGDFVKEIIPVKIKNNIINIDEGPLKSDTSKIPKLKPIFNSSGTITAASCSSISDGVAAVCLASSSYVMKNNIKPRARIVAHSSYSGDPKLFTCAPIYAIEKIFEKTGWNQKEVDLFEVNEAFAIVPIIIMKHFGIPNIKMNICGGSLSMGHPLGMSGCRIIVTLLHALERKQLKKGIAAICIGGGESLAIAIELI